jgi:hypothetical protein
MRERHADWDVAAARADAAGPQIYDRHRTQVNEPFIWLARNAPCEHTDSAPALLGPAGFYFTDLTLTLNVVISRLAPVFIPRWIS